MSNPNFGTFGRDFKSRDGRFVMICIFSDRHVDALAQAGGFGEAFKKIEATKGVDLKTDAGRWTARAELCAVIEPWVAGLTAAQATAALKKAGALFAPYQTFRELAADKANVLENPMFTVLDQPGVGRYPAFVFIGGLSAATSMVRPDTWRAYGRDPVGYPGALRSRDRQAP